MSVPTSNGVGITIFGLVLGLYPEHLIAGFCGAVWSLTYLDPMPARRRLLVTGSSTLVAGYVTPVVTAFAGGLNYWPQTVPVAMAQYPLALAIGFVAHHYLGPAILQFAAKKSEEINR